MMAHLYPFFPLMGTMHDITFAAVMAGGGNLPPEVNEITTAIQIITNTVLAIASGLAVLMIVIAGVFIILDREAAVNKRGERLAFIRSILIGYGIVLGASVLVNILQFVMKAAFKTP